MAGGVRACEGIQTVANPSHGLQAREVLSMVVPEASLGLRSGLTPIVFVLPVPETS